MSETGNQQLQADFDRGLSELKAGNVDAAIELFKVLIEAHDDYILGHFQLAHAYTQKENWIDASKCLDRVMELQPEWPNGVYCAGKVAVMLERFDDAIGYFTQALNLGLEPREALVSRGMALHSCKRLEEAIEDFNCVLVKEMDLTALHYRMACQMELHRYKEALDDVNALLKVSGEEQNEALVDIRKICMQHLPAADRGERIDISELS